MAKVIAIMGESGSGKTTSLRNLPPKETFYIDADGKGLSWKGWRNDYSVKNGNYAQSDNPDSILRMMLIVNGENCVGYVDPSTGRPLEIDKPQTKFKYLVIDTLNAIMIAEEMRRSKEKGYDKWMDLAISVYNIVKYAGKFRDDLTIIFLAHTETVNEDNGYRITRIATSGRKLQKIKLETMLNTVLYARAGDDGYKFITHSDGSTTAKTPMGAFKDNEIDNDIMIVLDALKEY